MARARNIKPSIMDNEELAELDPLTRLLFIYLWMLADREGRLEDRPKRIAAQTMAYDRAADADTMLNDLASYGFIKRYQINEKKFIQIINFTKHQTPHGTERDSLIPDENGVITVYERTDKGYITKVKQLINESLTVKQQLSNETLTVKQQNDNTLIPDSLIPDSLIPDSLIPDSLIPDSLIPDPGIADSDESSMPIFSPGVEKKPTLAGKKNQEPITRETWDAYSTAYESRYGAKPVRNATVSAQLAQFVKRIGKEESPRVAEFFVHHNNQFYVTKMHTVGLLLTDAEKLRTEWITRKTMTATQARQVDKKQSTANVFSQLIEEQRILAHEKD